MFRLIVFKIKHIRIKINIDFENLVSNLEFHEELIGMATIREMKFN